MAVVYAEVGQDAHICGGLLEDAVNEGVRRGYTDGYLRKSVVRDPIRRGNTGDNTPPCCMCGWLRATGLGSRSRPRDSAARI